MYVFLVVGSTDVLNFDQRQGHRREILASAYLRLDVHLATLGPGEIHQHDAVRCRVSSTVVVSASATATDYIARER